MSDGRKPHLMLRAIQEDIARIHIVEAERTERDRLDVLAELDMLPVIECQRLGELLLEMLDEISTPDEGNILWRFRRYLFSPPTPQLCFGACSRLDEATQEAFAQWTELRHHEHAERLECEAATLAVLLTPRPDRSPPWDTSLAVRRGPTWLSEEDLVGLRRLWSQNARIW